VKRPLKGVRVLTIKHYGAGPHATLLMAELGAEVGMRDLVDHPDRPGGLHLLAAPLKIDGERMPGMRSPKLGEHTEELLGQVPILDPGVFDSAAHQSGQQRPCLNPEPKL
jgi:crotonobetainyl-CoA:carnitine CoA-transferase CaiB-like acyl-CoA transferase